MKMSSVFLSRTVVSAQAVMTVAVAAALWLTPMPCRMQLALWLAGVWVAAAAAYSLTPWCSRVGALVLTAAMTMLGIGVTLNIGFFTTGSGGTASMPVLVNNDASVAWHNAMAYLGHSDGLSAMSRRGYGMVCAAMMAMGGVSIVVPLAFNVLATLWTLIMAGGLARTCGAARRDTWLAMALTASVCYLMGSGCILVKDTLVTAAVSSVAYGCAASDIRPAPRRIVLSLAGVALLMVLRPNLLPFMALGMLILFVGGKRRHTAAGVAAALTLTALWMLAQWTLMSAPVADVLTSNEASGMRFDHPNQMAYYNMRGNYALQPWYIKLVTLPASMVVQYLIPFPWNFMRDTVFGPTLLYSHISYPWYAIGGVALYYCVAVARRDSSAMRRRLMLWALVAFAMLAYITSGTVSRYFLPFVPLLIPAVTHTLTSCLRRRSFIIWALVYTVAMAAVLTVCHNMQMSAL